MTTVIDRPDQLARSARPRRLSVGPAFYLLASIVVTLLASSSAPTPLYPVYQSAWGFSAITTTVVFGAYAIAVLAALLVVGSLSDHIGRRPVLLGALLAQTATMWIFVSATGVPQLLTARIVQGLVTGAALGAVGAGLLDLDRVRGTVANAVAPMLGTGLGGLLGGAFAQFLPAPTRLVFIVLSVVFAAQAVGVLLMPETTPGQPGALASLRPEIGLPRPARAPMLVAAPVLFAVWALGGLFLALGPGLVRLTIHNGSNLLGGILVLVMGVSAATTVFLARTSSRPRPRQASMAERVRRRTTRPARRTSRSGAGPAPPRPGRRSPSPAPAKRLREQRQPEASDQDRVQVLGQPDRTSSRAAWTWPRSASVPVRSGRQSAPLNRPHRHPGPVHGLAVLVPDTTAAARLAETDRLPHLPRPAAYRRPGLELGRHPQRLQHGDEVPRPIASRFAAGQPSPAAIGLQRHQAGRGRDVDRLASQSSPVPTTRSASARLRAIISSIRSSTVPAVTSLWTSTVRSWPMR